jgi:hypothetical protein
MRRRSRMGILAQYIFPSLTPEPTDQLPTHPNVYRKPVPAHYPDTTMATTLLDPENGLTIREPPTQQQHSRTPSIPNILRKVRRSSPDMRAHGDDAPPLPPKSAVIPPVPAVPEPQAMAPRLKKVRERTRSNSLESGQQPQSTLQTHDGSSSPRFRSNSAQPPTARNGHVDSARLASVPQNIGSRSGDSSTGDSPHPEGRKLKRLFGGSRSGSQDASRKSGAWIMGPDSNVDYSSSFLANGEKVNLHIFQKRGELTTPGTGTVARKRQYLRLSWHAVKQTRPVFQDRLLLYQHITSLQRHDPGRYGLSWLSW